MSVTRINIFQARPDSAEALKAFCTPLAAQIAQIPGCLSCRLLQDQDDPTRLVFVEEWTDLAAHRAAVQNIPAEAMQQAMTLLGAPPQGAYYTSLS